MEEYILKNNLKLIYKHTDSELTSICISLNAGAGVETGKYGIAHVTEHMVYKGTKHRSEKQINEDLSNIFGFNNAMTNYSYVIYYGTLLKDDIEKGVELLSDIIINASFNDEGFKEEMDVIQEELEEWDEELEQYCEDKLFLNCFDNRRIKYPIIGTKESLENITIKDVKDFYDKYYSPENASIVIISSLEFKEIKDIVNFYFKSWENLRNKKSDREEFQLKKIEYEMPKIGAFTNKRDGIKACKIQMICPIDYLNNKELKCLRIFDQYFGVGVNSILYDILRTKNGLIYDVNTKIAHENYIKLYKIIFSTSKEKLNRSISLIEESIKRLNCIKHGIYEGMLEQLIKNLKLKRLFREEQSIILAKELATYDSMFGDFKIYTDEIYNLEKLNINDIFKIGTKVLEKMTIQIIEVE